MEGKELTVEIGGFKRITIHDGDTAHAGPCQHLRGVAPYAPNAHHQHVGRRETFCALSPY